MVKANELAGLPNPAGPVTAAALAWADVSGPVSPSSGGLKPTWKPKARRCTWARRQWRPWLRSGPTVGADAARDAHVPIDVLRADADAAELQGLRFRVAARLTGDALPAGSDVAVSVFHGFYRLSRTIRL